MQTNLNYVTLKRAAQILGVHEQTLRSWEKRGLIHMVRLPGSRYRRVPASEVDRLAREMDVDQPAGQVRMEQPNRDPEAVSRASELAELIASDLAMLDSVTSLEQLLAARRGRSWSP